MNIGHWKCAGKGRRAAAEGVTLSGSEEFRWRLCADGVPENPQNLCGAEGATAAHPAEISQAKGRKKAAPSSSRIPACSVGFRFFDFVAERTLTNLWVRSLFTPGHIRNPTNYEEENTWNRSSTGSQR